MKIAEPGSWLAGYILGTRTVQTFKRMGWARGKGEIKKEIRNWLTCYYEVKIPETSNLTLDFESSKGFIDAILDSVN